MSRTAGGSRRNGVRTTRRVVEPLPGQRNFRADRHVGFQDADRHPRLARPAAAAAALACAAAPASAGELIRVEGAIGAPRERPADPAGLASSSAPGRARAWPWPARRAAAAPWAARLRKARRATASAAPATTATAGSTARRGASAAGSEGARDAARLCDRVARAGRAAGPARVLADALLFAQVDRNTAYWPRRPFPASGDFVSFGRSEVLYRYFPGRGLQFHPLGTFKRANLLYGACEGWSTALQQDPPAPPARRDGALRGPPQQALDRLGVHLRLRRRLAAVDQRHGQATGIQALGHASMLLGPPPLRRASPGRRSAPSAARRRWA